MDGSVVTELLDQSHYISQAVSHRQCIHVSAFSSMHGRLFGGNQLGNGDEKL